MSAKTMIFVDGVWLYKARQAIFAAGNQDKGFEIDYSRIPDIIAHNITQILGHDVDIVRSCYFGMLPTHKSGFNPSKQKSFFDFLVTQCAYDTEITEVDFRREPKHSEDSRNVQVGLASSMMQLAAMPGAFDIAALVGGSANFIPLLRRVRQMGKRSQLVTIGNDGGMQMCNVSLLTDPTIHDFPPIFLEEHVESLKLSRNERVRKCDQCSKSEPTTWGGQEFFCQECRDANKHRLRVCDTCGREEETTWDKPFFYCIECRREHRENDG